MDIKKGNRPACAKVFIQGWLSWRLEMWLHYQRVLGCEIWGHCRHVSEDLAHGSCMSDSSRISSELNEGGCWHCIQVVNIAYPLEVCGIMHLQSKFPVLARDDLKFGPISPCQRLVYSGGIIPRTPKAEPCWVLRVLVG